MIPRGGDPSSTEEKLRQQLVTVQTVAIKKIQDMTTQIKLLDEKNRKLELEESVMLRHLHHMQKKLQDELDNRDFAAGTIKEK